MLGCRRVANVFQLIHSVRSVARAPKTVLGLFLGSIMLPSTQAQIQIPSEDITQVSPGMSDVIIKLGDTRRRVQPSPFEIDAVLPYSSASIWFCLDPVQAMVHLGNAASVGNPVLNYGSTNPSDFDLWTPDSAGLSASRQQMLADLFTQYPITSGLNTNLLDYASALQLAVWEITNELGTNPLLLSSGSLQVAAGQSNPALSAGTISTAQSMLDWVSGPTNLGTGNLGQLRFLIDGSYAFDSSTRSIQDLVGWSPVPEPAHVSIAGAALLLLMIVTVTVRRRLSSRGSQAETLVSMPLLAPTSSRHTGELLP